VLYSYEHSSGLHAYGSYVKTGDLLSASFNIAAVISFI